MNRLVETLKKFPKSNRFSFYPKKDRKNKIKIVSENILWLLRYREIHNFYYVYGSDLKGAKIFDYQSYTKIMKMRDKRNNSHYYSLLRDKFVFSQYMASINMPTPINYYLGQSDSLTKIHDLPKGEVEAFCKDLTGFGGSKVFPIKIIGNKIYRNDNELTAEWFNEHMASRFILQQKISQHKRLDEVYKESINTLRILTENNGNKIRIVSAIMRFGANGSSTDNWANGGLIVKVNMENGTLQDYGYFKNVEAGKVVAHPDSGTKFKNFSIPYYHEACNLAIDLHRYFYGFHSVGWDLALTPQGPIIIEGNDNWDVAMQQKFYKKEMIEMFNN